MSGKDSQLVAAILKDLSVDVYPLAHHILKFAVESGDDAIPVDLISPEYIPFEVERSAERYQAATIYLTRLNCISIWTADGTPTIDLSPWIKKVL